MNLSKIMAKDKSEENPPVKKSMEVEISFPKCVKVELVQGNELRHYEISFGLASLFASAATGFWTSYLSGIKTDTLWWVSFTFTIFALVFIGIAIFFRKKMAEEKITKNLIFKDFS
jgi:hypothetical protein